MLRIAVTELFITRSVLEALCARGDHTTSTLVSDVVSCLGMKQQIKAWLSKLIMSYLLAIHTCSANLIGLIYFSCSVY